MKKLSMLALLLSVTALAGCGEKPVDNPLESLVPGEVPTGGEEVSMEELESILNAEAPEQAILRNGYAVSVKIPNFEVSSKNQRTSNYDYETGSVLQTPKTTNNELSFKLNEGSLELAVACLTNASTFAQLQASAKANAKVSFSLTDTDISLNNESMLMEFYLKENKLYGNASRNLLDLMGASSDEPTQVYGVLPEGIEEMIQEETGLTFPLLSQANIDYIEGLIEEQMNSQAPEQPDQDVSAMVDLIDDFAKVVYENLFSVNKYGSEYLLTLNLTKENINSNVEKLIDAANEQGLLTYIVGGELNEEQYTQFKTEIMNVVSQYTSGINHIKYSVVFDATMVKSMAFDIDASLTIDDSDSWVEYDFETNTYVDINESSTNTTVIKGGFTVNFTYSDEVSVSYPDFSNYVEQELFGGSEAKPEPIPGM